MAIPLAMCSSFLICGDTTSSSLRVSVATPPLTPCRFPLLSSTRRSSSIAAAAKPATTKAKREPTGIMKPRRVSPEMQAFLGGVPEIARTETLKKIWDYIKQQNLQDPENKKIIICDDNLKKIFNDKDRVGFLEIAKLITPHFLK
ncbi:upstream activation factor subunit spp27-like [Impatiens glandulifera]|uniref:upstream activation factor subunit spp27-like n=1 Tax=Impatiens glandulifera TaxID=253017 RepID=UPI001FB18E20|nr:upstream activation factor subunit spp27-like [Impatiens glandulifera]